MKASYFVYNLTKSIEFDSELATIQSSLKCSCLTLSNARYSTEYHGIGSYTMLPHFEEAVSRLERQAGGCTWHAPNIQLQVADVAMCHRYGLLLTGSFYFCYGCEIIEYVMKRNLEPLLFIVPVVVLGLLYIIFQSTDPASVGPGGVLGVFVLIYVGCLSVLFIILRFGLYWIKKVLALRKGSARAYVLPAMGTRKAYYVASVLAFAPVTLLAMHAYSQLQFSDVALVALLVTVVTFYVVKRR